ncbi:unnamed protein product [Calicophoron daubneyi]|uniref:DDHD domain-containing protein n=1 Tax=Calicophoron daubneyi TaxID=300641 RepID=A0AAV2T6G8_CALDB
MLIKEYRICLPLTVAEYRVAQLYMIQKKSREESTGRGSGVEIIRNEPYEDGPGGKGQYTFKIYHVGSHLPAWLRSILPPSALRVEEEAWNAYPYTRTVYKVPFVDKFVLDIETYYFDDGGGQDDVFKLSKEDKAARIVDYIDIVRDSIAKNEYIPEEDPTIYVSSATGRGPLTADWREDYWRAQSVTHELHSRSPTRTPDNQQPMDRLSPLPKRIMCAYKLCRVEFKYWGMQKRIEQFIHDYALRKTMVRAHRQVWTWQDEWYGLTIEDIRKLEQETARALAKKMAEDDANEAEIQIDNSSSETSSVNQQIADIQRDIQRSAQMSKPNGPIPISSIPTAATATRTGGIPDGLVPYDSEENDLWSSLKRLENNGSENLDYEPYSGGENDDALSFVTCHSQMTNQPNLSGELDSAVDSFCQDMDSMVAANQSEDRLQSGQKMDKLVLILVVHGGCLVDAGNDLSTKESDVKTLKKTIETVLANHYPVLKNRIAVRLTPCPDGLAEAFQLLARIKTSPIDPKLPIEVQLARDVMPLGSVPLLFTTSPGYPHLLNELASRLNAQYAEFTNSSEGANFNGVVCVIADCVGAILTYDLLNIVARHLDGTLTSDMTDGLSVIDAGVRRWRDLAPSSLNPGAKNHDHSSNGSPRMSISQTSSPSLRSRGSPKIVQPVLDFHINNLLMLGSPVGLILAFRHQLYGSITPNSDDPSFMETEFKVAADQVCNLFHSNDPGGFRVEPLLHPRFEQIAPVLVPQYARYPLGDSQPISLVETLLRQAKLFESPSATPTESAIDGNKVPRQKPTNIGKNWEKATLIAFEALKQVRKQWWGQQRIDFTVHCPEGTQALVARARSPIFHASYWESKDVSAFILRQLLDALGFNLPDASYAVDMDDEVAVAGLASLSLHPAPNQNRDTLKSFDDDGNSSPGCPDRVTYLRGGSSYSNGSSPMGSTVSTRIRLKRQLTDGAKNVKSNHRANDVVVLDGDPQIITARFVFGLLDLLSMSNERIYIQTRSYDGPWTALGTEVTDASGRIRFRVPDQRRFGIGLHPILLTPDSDVDHPVEITLAVVPPATETVVFSLDGSFAASLSIMGKDPKVRPGSVDIARHWQSLGYLLIYLSARPDMQQRRVTSWLSNHNFPQGIALFVEGISTDPLRQKAQLLKTVTEKARLKIHCAYGSGKDVHMYRSFGLEPQNIFVVGRVSKSQASQATRITTGYAAHLAELVAGHPSSVEASGAISAVVRCPPLDLSTVRASPLLSQHRSVVCSSGRYSAN